MSCLTWHMKGFQGTLLGHTNQFWLCVLATVTVDAMILSSHQIQVQTCQTIPPILMCVCGYASVDMFVDSLSAVSRCFLPLENPSCLWIWSPDWTTPSRFAAPTWTILHCGATGVNVTTSTWTVRTISLQLFPQLCCSQCSAKYIQIFTAFIFHLCDKWWAKELFDNSCSATILNRGSLSSGLFFEQLQGIHWIWQKRRETKIFASGSRDGVTTLVNSVK